jgi:excisionase family DNA binding protein
MTQTEWISFGLELCQKHAIEVTPQIREALERVYGDLDGPVTQGLSKWAETMKRRNRGRKAAPIPSGVESDILTLHEVADSLNCHYTTVYRLVRQGELPVFRVGSDYRVRHADLAEWLEGRRTRPDDKTPPALGRKRKF